MDNEKVVYSGLVKPDHHQYWLRDDVEWDAETLHDNEIPGAFPLVALDASGHMAAVLTGMYGFDLPLTVEVWSRRPEPDLTGWEEAIEFSLTLGQDAYVESLFSDSGLDLRLPEDGSYRVRLHATGRQAATERQHISVEQGDELVEKHLIQLWVAPSAPPEWLKELSEPSWEPDSSLPRTDFYAETTDGQYWLTDYTTGQQSADVTGRGNGVVLPQRNGNMAAIFTSEPESIVEVVLDVLHHEPAPEPGGWDAITEVSMVFTGPDIGCNFLEDASSPAGYQELPAAEDESRTYRVRVSVKRRHELAGHTDPRHAERHLIQIWPAPEGPDKTWK
ncbi:hypothetical protein SMC26_29415 [Actinomadura fulvescens]|uniref:hypothetical protein n=1 Tax=Actinomadura fulvescens TaxID=46160 RepID=UPI0031DDA9E5